MKARARVLDRFRVLYREHRGHDYRPSWGRDYRLIDSLLSHYSEAQIDLLTRSMLVAPDRYPFSGTDRGLATLKRTASYIETKLRDGGAWQ